MKKGIKTIILILILMVTISGQAVFAADYDFDTSVYNHLENRDTEFEVDYYNADALEVIKDISKKDDYLSMSIKRLEYYIKGNSAALKVIYLTTKEQEEYINTELKKVINSIIKNNMSDFEKISEINKYIVNRYEYDDSLVSNNVYSALTTGKTTCQGYAMTAYKMLKLAGIENKIVIGTLDDVAHGWNLVNLNGKWYHLDITNNDVTNNKYFLKNDNYLRNYGFRWEANNYPISDENYQDSSNNYGQPSIGYISHIDGNWYQNNGSWYFLKDTRSNALGWNIIDNKWYCLGSTGAMQTGWIHYSGKWYYCDTINGDMAVNAVIDGYKVDSTGAWVE